MESTSPVPANGLYRILVSTPSRSASADLPADSDATARGGSASAGAARAGTGQTPDGMAGLVVKLIDARLYKILLLQVQRSILLKTEMPLKQGQIIQLVRDKAGGYQTGTITRLPLEVINQTLRQTLPMQQPLSRLLNRWLSQNLAARSNPANPGRKPADPTRADAVRPDPVRKPADPTRADAVRPDPVRTDSAKPVVPRADSSHTWLLLTRLIREIPPNQQLRQPAAVREQILNNGIFHESTSRDEKKAGRDLKGSLIQLKQQIERSLRSNLTQQAGRSTSHGARQTASLGTPTTTNPAAGQGSPTSGFPGRGLGDLATRSFTPMPEQTRDRSTAQYARTQQISPSQISGLKNLLFQTHQAIARIQAFQLQSASAQLSSQDRNQWFMEIPVRSDDHIDVFNLQISEEPHQRRESDSEAGPQQSGSQSKQPKKWTIHLEFDLPGLGPMTATLIIIDETVSLSIWAEQRSTYETALAHLDQLESRLRDKQLELDRISCHIGSNRATSAGPYTAPNETAPGHQFQFGNLIDLNT